MIATIKIIPPAKDNARATHCSSLPKYGVLYTNAAQPRAVKIIPRVPPQYLRPFMRGES